MTNEEQFLLAMALFDYVAAICLAIFGKERDSEMVAIFGLIMSMIWVWRF